MMAAGNQARTLFDKVWDAHVIEPLGDGWALLHVDRHLLHDLSGSRGLAELDRRELPVRNPELALAVPDHAVSSAPGRTGGTFPGGESMWRRLRDGSGKHGIRLFDIGDPSHGIVHVTGPEQGFVLPGSLVVCGDSHTCTNGALGALAFGIGSSELMHVLATQTLAQRKPSNMRIRFEGHLAQASAKDLILATIGRLGAAAGTGYAIEYCGSVIGRMTLEERLTVCNLSIEMGAKFGMVAPDATTFEYLAGRPFAPRGELFERAVAHWETLASDEGAHFDREESIDASEVVPMMTWGTSPEHVIAVGGRVPRDEDAPDATHRDEWRSAREYMGLEQGSPLLRQRVDRVFIGSCTNSRLSDLVAAAGRLRGRRVAAHVEAWVVPGSEQVKREAEALGLHEQFKAAGILWREPGCSMCVAANGEAARPGQRVISTSNRNFVGRQGSGVRTHLASPETAVACALAGAIVDPREL
jgi:3-isopropylmalate/(R)-2-methylmalate dehydratase large subunit